MGRSNYEYNEDNRFVNPYTFIELSSNKKETVNACEFYSNKELLTGEIRCKLILKTPLSIIDSECVKVEGNHCVYDFYKLDKKYMIPGSSIRGEIRNLYETLTNSCMLTTDSKEHFTRRILPKDAFKPAILIKELDGWKLYGAEKEVSVKYNIPTNVNHGDCVGENAYCCKAELFPTKKNGKGYHVFKKTSTVLVGDSERIKKLMDNLKYTIDITRKFAERSSTSYHGGFSWYEYSLKKGIMPVWVDKKDGNRYLSLSQIGRSTYYNPLERLLKDKSACKGSNAVCPACLLFGMIADNNSQKSIGSRVRFTDATNVVNKGLEYTTLKELGSPKESFLPFYLKQGMHYDSKDAVISGRKFYWHIPNAAFNRNIYSTNIKDKRNTTVQLMKVDSIFEFKIYYNNITKNQLENLVWCLNFGENVDKGNFCHKIGHGKPLGLGSVKIVVDKVINRTIDEDGYILREYDGSSIFESYLTNPEYRFSRLDEVKKVFDFSAVKGEKVCYPFVNGEGRENDVAAHQWFSTVSNLNKDKRKYVGLPDVLDKDQTLPSCDFVRFKKNPKDFRRR